VVTSSLQICGEAKLPDHAVTACIGLAIEPSQPSGTVSTTKEDLAIAHLLIAPDKFRSTATALEVGAACCRAAAAFGHVTEVIPLADGGEGLLEVVGGSLEATLVEGPLGAPVLAAWRFLERPADSELPTAVIEMATASGLALVGGAPGNDPIRATTRGTGDLILAALDRGARRIIIGLGGSATTDGGTGMLDAVADDPRLRDVQLLAACDVTTTFVDAASIFGPQKGADPSAIEYLTERLRHQADAYLERFGIEVSAIPGSGAAGGLGGGLAALGAELRSGFGLVAGLVGLDEAIGRADLVVTGEGRLDATSFSGKVVGGVRALVEGRADLCCVVGDATTEAIELAGSMPVLALTARYGLERALAQTSLLIESIFSEYLTTWAPPTP
jgi:glycerate kinase